MNEKELTTDEIIALLRERSKRGYLQEIIAQNTITRIKPTDDEPEDFEAFVSSILD